MPIPYRVREEPARELAPASPSSPRPLGRLRSTHQSGGTVRRVLAGATGIAGVLAVLAVAWPSAPWLVACSLALAFAVASWVLVASALGLDVVAEVHDGGILIRRSWRRAVVIPFDDVRAMHQDLSTYAFLLENGRRIVVPANVADASRLRAAIETHVERPVLDAALEALRSAEPLTFGTLTLELDGLRHLDDLLPWSDLDRVRITDGAFVFIQKATQHSFVVVATRTLPFPRVLAAVLARRTRIEADDPFWTRFLAP